LESPSDPHSLSHRRDRGELRSRAESSPNVCLAEEVERERSREEDTRGEQAGENSRDRQRAGEGAREIVVRNKVSGESVLPPKDWKRVSAIPLIAAREAT
jgi:hypothetical protein